MCLPQLVQQVDLDDGVCHTRSDVSINWILFIGQRTHLLSTQPEYVISCLRYWQSRAEVDRRAENVAEMMV